VTAEAGGGEPGSGSSGLARKAGRKGARRAWRRRVAELVHRAENRGLPGTRRRVRFSLYVIRLIAQVLRQWARDHCPQQAASLAFQTVLSVVPVLAVCLAALRATGLIEAESALVNFLSERFIPVSRAELSRTLLAWSENVTFQSLGLVGLVTTVILGFVMWSSLEQIMNHIWRVERRRSVAQKFMVFYATATIGPLLIGVSLYQAAKFGLVEGGSGLLVSLVCSFLALFLANYFLPGTRVRVRPAAIGAAVTTVLFELAKYLFNLYVSEVAFERYSGVYGALAVAPICLAWIYWSWLMLLLGAEVAHAAQNIRLLERSERRGVLSLENELLHRVNGPTAARVMVAVSEAYLSGKKVLSHRQIADRFDLSPDAVERLARRLKDADLLIEVEGDYTGFVPARPPGEITLADVLAAFRTGDRDGAGGDRSGVDAVLAEIEAGALARTAPITLAQLASAGGAPPAGDR
jgi:membrane protein